MDGIQAIIFDFAATSILLYAFIDARLGKLFDSRQEQT